MAYNYLDTLREDTAAEPARLAGLLEMALGEYKKCMAHDEEIAIPDGLPQELLRRLDHGRDLALARARVVGEAIEANINRLSLENVPAEFRAFHKEHAKTRSGGLSAALEDGR